MGYYFALPFIYLLSLLPFRAMYVLSDLLYLVIYHVVKYRRDVVTANLHNSFPEKSRREISGIAKAYYHHLCDVTLETFKTLTITRKEALRRCRFHNTAVFAELYEKHQSIILALGHFGNWEWGGSSMALDTPYKLYVIYHPLKDKGFDGLMSRMRSRFGAGLIPMKNTLRDMVKHKNELTATAFIADQTPSNPANAYWTTFLNQDTPVFEGTERIARMLKYPVVYASVKKIKRGYYEIFAEMLVEDPAATRDGEITEMFTRRLEKDIRAQPETWLWSHRRWKHKRPVGM